MATNKMDIMKSIVGSFAVFLLSTTTGYAAPSITSISGPFIHGGPTTIVGTQFGAKSIAAPWVWDNFNDGIDGQVLGTSPKGFWQPYSTAGSGFPTYSTIGSRNGSLIGRKVCTNEQFFSYGRTGLGGTEMYYSIWFKWQSISGGTRSVMKLVRLNTQGGFYSTTPSTWVTMQPSVTNGGWVYSEPQSGAGGLGQFDVIALSHNVWHRIEVYWRLSTPGVPDGEYRYYLDGVEAEAGIWSNVVTRAAGSASAQVDNFLLPFMHSEAGTNVLAYHADDVYVDRTRARVEVCLGSKWASRGLCEVQIPTRWTADSIEVTGNRGGFSSFANTFLYVVDSSGNANATGFPLACSPSCGDIQPPSAPMGLRVQ